MYTINASSDTFRALVSVPIECTSLPRAILQSFIDAEMLLFPPVESSFLIDVCSNVGLPQIEAARFIEDYSVQSVNSAGPTLAGAHDRSFQDIVGPPGSGKSRACCLAVASSMGACMSTVVWIDCDGSFSAGLLLMLGIPLTSLSRVFVVRAYHWTELVSTCNVVPLIVPHCSALVVDSMSSLLRHELNGSFDSHCRKATLLTNLVEHLTTLNCSVIVTNQMTTKFDDISASDGDTPTPELSPCLGTAYQTALSAAGARDLRTSYDMHAVSTWTESVGPGCSQ